MGIFDKGNYVEPKYSFLEKYIKIMYKGFWTPAKYEKLIINIIGENNDIYREI